MVMVFESIINPILAEKKPYSMMFLSFLYMTIAIFLSYWIFRSQASMVTVFLAVFAAFPIMYRVIRLEEKKDTKTTKEPKMLKEHMKAISFFIWMFIGFVLATAFWYVILPENIVFSVFSAQSNTLTSINAAAIKSGLLFKIFFNNLRVLLLCVLFSLLYGIGAIFILIWNATVLGTVIGNFIRIELAKIVELVGFSKISSYFSIISFALLKYALHGIPEMASYFIAGLSGGIISFAVVNHDYRKKNFKNIMGDAGTLLAISLILLFIAAILEVYITPILF